MYIYIYIERERRTEIYNKDNTNKATFTSLVAWARRNGSQKTAALELLLDGWIQLLPGVGEFLLADDMAAPFHLGLILRLADINLNGGCLLL